MFSFSPQNKKYIFFLLPVVQFISLDSSGDIGRRDFCLLSNMMGLGLHNILFQHQHRDVGMYNSNTARRACQIWQINANLSSYNFFVLL